MLLITKQIIINLLLRIYRLTFAITSEILSCNLSPSFIFFERKYSKKEKYLGKILFLGLA